MKQTCKKWRMCLSAVMAFAVLFAAMPSSMVSASVAGLPKPGERLADKGMWSRSVLLMDDYDGAEIDIQRSAERLSEYERFEAVIVGDTLEFCGTAVLTYENGRKVYPIHEVFADGERLTFFLDSTQTTNAEWYVQLRSVMGTVDTTLYFLPIRKDSAIRLGYGKIGSLASVQDFLVEGCKDTPYRLSRPIGEGSVYDVLIYGSNGDLLDGSTVVVARPANLSVCSPSSWAVDVLTEATTIGLSTNELSYGHQTTTTRAEFCRAAVNWLRQYGYDVDGVKPKTFTDTSDRAIGIAAALKITGGTNATGTEFSPNRELTREEAAAMLNNVLAVIGKQTKTAAATWKDAENVSSWAKQAVNDMYNHGVMGSVATDSLTFSPKGAFTHEQSVCALLRLYKYAEGK